MKISVTLRLMGRLRLRLTTVERPALLLVAAIGSAVVIAGIVVLWWRVGGNVAGWVTSVAVVGLAFLLTEVLGVGDAFAAASKRTQLAISAGALVLAAAGSIGYVIWPGTTSWYLAGLPAIPIILVLNWSSGDDSPSGQGSGFSDGPWTAP